jgi:hypothetical protein
VLLVLRKKLFNGQLPQDTTNLLRDTATQRERLHQAMVHRAVVHLADAAEGGGSLRPPDDVGAGERPLTPDSSMSPSHRRVSSLPDGAYLGTRPSSARPATGSPLRAEAAPRPASSWHRESEPEQGVDELAASPARAAVGGRQMESFSRKGRALDRSHSAAK